MKPVYWILIAVAVVLILAVTFVIGRKSAGPAKQTEKNVPPEKPEEAPKMQPEPDPEPEADPVLAAFIGRYAHRFNGLYEGLYLANAPEAPVPDAYGEWQVRIESLREDEAFYRAFTEAFPRQAEPFHVKRLLACIRAAGIERQPQNTHVADQTTRERYVYLGSGPVTLGETYRVLKPCWLRQGQVVEQGALLPKED